MVREKDRNEEYLQSLARFVEAKFLECHPALLQTLQKQYKPRAELHPTKGARTIKKFDLEVQKVVLETIKELIVQWLRQFWATDQRGYEDLLRTTGSEADLDFILWIIKDNILNRYGFNQNLEIGRCIEEIRQPAAIAVSA